MASLKIAHESDDDAVTAHCLAGETRYLTRHGVRTLAETAGTTQPVLTGDLNGGDRHAGRWVEASIRSFGVQPLLRVRLSRGKVKKDIYATAEHRWLVRSDPRRLGNRIATTNQLSAGHRLSHLRAIRIDVPLDREGIRRGIHFGDGVSSSDSRSGRIYGCVTLWGEKAKSLAEYFEEIGATPHPRVTENDVRGVSFSAKMVDWRKDLPPIDADPEYLYGWLAGYFAADGSVCGSQIAFNSSVRENLEHVRDICTLLGIGTWGISFSMRKGYGREPSPSFDLTLSRNDLDRDFFLRGDHRDRFDLVSQKEDKIGWIVVGVYPTDRVEEVFCAVVPGTESFVLEDNIWSGNCPWCGSGQLNGTSDGSIHCGFCQRSYTVRIQPQFPAMPQEPDQLNAGEPQLNDQGQQVPGQEPTDPNAAAPTGATDDGGEGPIGPDADHGLGDPGAEESPGESDEPQDGPPMMRTQTGALLALPDYLDHLAIHFADHDRARVIARVKARRQRG